MIKKIIIFDLDDTLAVTKSPISDRMSKLLTILLEYYEVCIISGGRFEQFKTQVLDRLHVSTNFTNLHLMPTCGTRYYRFDEKMDEWRLQYANDLSDEQKQRVTNALQAGAKELGLWNEDTYGEVIEDRGSQITFSALGQQAPPEEKYKWDPTGEKKHALRDYVAPLVPDLEVRVGGATSVDVTLIGIDKAYGVDKIITLKDLAKEEILFVGDRLEEGGNDYPVKAMGIESIAVTKWEDTAEVIETLNKIAK